MRTWLTRLVGLLVRIGFDVPYDLDVPEQVQARLNELAELVSHGRDAYFDASAAGFRPQVGSEARVMQDAAQMATWPSAPWSESATVPMHEVALLITLSAAGHLGEMSALLEHGEVVYSAPLLARGVAENCARLFAIFTRPLRHVDPSVGPPTLADWKRVYAAAYLEILDSGFAAVRLADETLGLDPSNQDLVDAAHHARTELDRLRNAFGSLFDPASTDVSTRGRLKLEGVVKATMTELLNDFAEWMWPDLTNRPAPLYRVLSGYAHSSLDAQRALYEVDDSTGTRHLKRSVPLPHVEYNVAVAAIVFQRMFARLTGFYNWPEEPLHAYSEHLARALPGTFSYG